LLKKEVLPGNKSMSFVRHNSAIFFLGFFGLRKDAGF